MHGGENVTLSRCTVELLTLHNNSQVDVITVIQSFL